MNTAPSSINRRVVMVLLGCASMLRSDGVISALPILFWIGAMASVRNEIVAPALRQMLQRGKREIAMRIEQRQAFAVGQVLGDEVEQQRRLAGAGLADDVQMPASFFRCNRNPPAIGGDAELERGVFRIRHGRKGAGVPCAPR